MYRVRHHCQILTKTGICQQTVVNSQTPNFMKIHSAIGKLLHVNRYAKASMCIFGLPLHMHQNTLRITEKKLFLQKLNEEGSQILWED